MSIKFLSKSVEETFNFGIRFAAGEIININKKKVFFLKGELGSGKTSFVRGFCSFWDLEDYVSSPSFSLVNEYFNEKVKIIHADFYRLKSSNELDEIGFNELIENSDYVFIEWPEIIENSFKNFCILYFFYSEIEEERIIEVTE